MKTKSLKSPGSLLVRGKNFYAFWRVKDSTDKPKAICKALRDENGAPITTRPEAEKAKARLMAIVAKQGQVETLRSIQHAIDDTQKEIGVLQDAQTKLMTLTQAWAEFLSPTSGRKNCNKSSLREYESKWSMFHSWMQQNHPAVTALRDVTPALAKEYLDSVIKRGVSPATYNQNLALLGYVFKTLKDAACLADNVWSKYKPLEVRTQSRRDLTVDELRQVIGTATGELKVMFAIGTYTGLRLGDCATLKWNEVDLARGTIRRVPRKMARRNPVMIVIPIHPVLRNVLAEIPTKERGEYVNPVTAKIYLSGKCTAVTDAIQKHFTDCGIATTRERENGVRRVVEVGFHSLRHTFVSMCREANAPLSVVESIVGHSNPAMTRHYTHTSELAAFNAVNLLADVTGDAGAIKPARQAPEEILRDVRAIVAGMTVKNLRAKKSAALKLLEKS
jgi:integrase